MQKLDQLLNGFDPSAPLNEAWMPPSGWYTDPDMLALERSGLLGNTWHLVGHIGQLSQPGDCIGGRRLNLPWLVTRTTDGTLRAFHNTCRHKGAILLDGCSRGDNVVCPFHGWRYGLDGTLKRTPQIGAIRNFDRAEMSLPPMGVAQWGPLILVHPDPNATPPAELHPKLNAGLARSGWSTLEHAGRFESHLNCNWKVFVDNYLDGGYHIEHMHPSLAAQLDMDSYRTTAGTRTVVQTSSASQVPDDSLDYDIAERMGEGAIYAWLYPNLMINRYGPGMDTHTVIPQGVDRCEVIFDFFFPPDTDPDFIATSITQSRVTQQEDVEICRAVQQGLNSVGYDRGRYSPRWEIGELLFHRWLHADLTTRR